MHVSEEQLVIVEQSGVIPFREDAEGQIEVLLVTRSNNSGWTIPKGGIEPHLSPAQSAAKEAFEEAGVLGIVADERLGAFRYWKNDSQKHVHIFAMQVTCVLDGWPEMAARTRQWVPIHEARWLVTRHGIGQLIADLADELQRIDLPRLAAA